VEINVKNDGDAMTIDLCGRLDVIGAPLLQQTFDEMPGDSPKTNVTLDFSAVEYVSSAGLRVLLILQKKLAAAQGSLLIKNLQAQVREVFDMTGFSAIFKII
jgi:anti-anti-sigma factor